MALTIEQCECIPADSAPVLVVSGAIALGTDTLDGVLTVAVRHLQASGSRSLGEDCPWGAKTRGVVLRRVDTQGYSHDLYFRTGNSTARRDRGREVSPRASIRKVEKLRRESFSVCPAPAGCDSLTTSPA
jgi:hypothetical protein